jgi:hydroxyacylglutathione hydrolase
MSSSVESTPGPASITPISAFSDNYIWLLRNGDGTALVVDPGDAAVVDEALAEAGLDLAAILITHHHFDHVGGLASLKARHRCPVYGPDNPQIEGIDHVLRDGDRCRVGAFDFEILAVPGHTLDHIAYFQHGAYGETPLLFCGDTLFAAGCGRIFEGTPEMMHASLERLASLPADTAVYCAHEYTLANIAFARAADPANHELAERERQAVALRERARPTLPSTIGLETATNPFLRAGHAELRAGLQAAGHSPASDGATDTFAALRAWKDHF